MHVITVDIIGRSLVVLHKLGFAPGMFKLTAINDDTDILKTIVKCFCFHTLGSFELNIVLFLGAW